MRRGTMAGEVARELRAVEAPVSLCSDFDVDPVHGSPSHREGESYTLRTGEETRRRRRPRSRSGSRTSGVAEDPPALQLPPLALLVGERGLVRDVRRGGDVSSGATGTSSDGVAGTSSAAGGTSHAAGGTSSGGVTGTSSGALPASSGVVAGRRPARAGQDPLADLVGALQWPRPAVVQRRVGGRSRSRGGTRPRRRARRTRSARRPSAPCRLRPARSGSRPRSRSSAGGAQSHWQVLSSLQIQAPMQAPGSS